MNHINNYRCVKERANFVGMYPTGNFHCDYKNLKKFFRLCIKNNFSILEKPNRECQKLILDLDVKEEEIPITIILNIVKRVREIFLKPLSYIICKRKNSFGVHLHFLGILVNDEIYKNLTKHLKEEFPIVDTTPFNHFIPGTGKPGKTPYLPVDGNLELIEKYSTHPQFLLTKNLTGYEMNWEFLHPQIDIKPPPRKHIFKSTTREDALFKLMDEIDGRFKGKYCEAADDYMSWFKIGSSIKYLEDTEEGLELFKRFSSLSEKYDEDESEKLWESLSPSFGGIGIIISTVYGKKESSNKNLLGNVWI